MKKIADTQYQRVLNLTYSLLAVLVLWLALGPSHIIIMLSCMIGFYTVFNSGFGYGQKKLNKLCNMHGYQRFADYLVCALIMMLLQLTITAIWYLGITL